MKWLLILLVLAGCQKAEWLDGVRFEQRRDSVPSL